MRRAVALSLLLAPAAFATKVPIPIEGANLNIGLQLQPQFQVTEAARPDGTGAAEEFFVRRTRLLINGDVGGSFTYLFQIDNPNFGKYGNFTSRAIVQDAVVGWAPTGITGPSVVFIEAGLILFPFSHQSVTSTSNYITADGQTDGVRFPGSPFNANRDTGLQLRGWALNKKLGFRGGVYEGYTPAGATLGASPANANTAAVANCATATPGSCVTPKRYPMLRGFLNFSVIGAEEGTYLYGAYKWAKDPVVSIGVATNYQSQALKNLFGSLTDLKMFSADVYANIPMSEANEFVAEITAFSNNNGTGSANTGLGLAAAAGYRIGWIAPYVAYDYFTASDCDSSLSTAQLATCNSAAGRPHNADSRNFKAGLNFFFNKNLNHVNVEFQVNHGTATYGPQAISGANAAYVPLSLDPLTTGGPRRPLSSAISLAQPAFKSLLVHWNYIF
jgi:hypothetical protein